LRPHRSGRRAHSSPPFFTRREHSRFLFLLVTRSSTVLRNILVPPPFSFSHFFLGVEVLVEQPHSFFLEMRQLASRSFFFSPCVLLFSSAGIVASGPFFFFSSGRDHAVAAERELFFFSRPRSFLLFFFFIRFELSGRRPFFRRRSSPSSRPDFLRAAEPSCRGIRCGAASACMRISLRAGCLSFQKALSRKRPLPFFSSPGREALFFSFQTEPAS